MDLTWFFEGCPKISPRMLCPYCKTLGHVMQSSESPNDMPRSDMGSHIFETLDDGKMGLVLTYMVMVAHRWAEVTHLGIYTPDPTLHWMEDVA
jgi:hypothetical protein